MLKNSLKLLLILTPLTLLSFERVDGEFTAQKSCFAYSSIKKKTNSHQIELNKKYRVVGKNRANESHYQIVIDKSKKWITKECGRVNFSNTHSQKDSNKKYVLAISWQNSFCQLNQKKPECKDRYDSESFSLHGLWPEKLFCNVNRELKKSTKSSWCKLPRLDLSRDVALKLSNVMPGTISCLHRYEWVKHGTCYSDSPNEYYLESVSLVNQINSSYLKDFFKRNIGKKVNSSEIKKAFDRAFGKGSGDRIKINCKRGLITEIQINLKGEIEKDTKIESLIKTAPKKSIGCKGGVIDAVGF